MAEIVTFTSLKNQILSRKFAPIYLLHGEETFFIDELVKLFENVLPPSERDFNQYVLYAQQVEPATVMETCQRYPMMSDFQIVILKEAQAVNANYLNALVPYVSNPSLSTILVIAARGFTNSGKDIACADLKKKITASRGVIFESKKLNERMLGSAIVEFIKGKGLNVEPKALSMLQDYVGSDLSRIYNEVDKLTMILGNGAMVTPESIERNIGVSKDYNTFELIAALASKDAGKAFKIIDYFKKNPKNNPVQPIASLLFNFYSNLLIAAYSKDKTDAGLLNQLGFKWPRQLVDIKAGLRCYNAWQMIAAIDAIRRLDAGSKGQGSSFNAYDLLRDTVFTLITTTGR